MSTLSAKLLLGFAGALILFTLLIPSSHPAHSQQSADPYELQLVGAIGGTVDTVVVADNLAFVGGARSLAIIDISTVSSAIGLSRLIFPDRVHNIQVVGSRAYLAVGNAGLYILDVRNPTAPLIIGQLEDLGIATNVWVTDFTAYIASVDRGLYIVDISTPQAPVVIGHYVETAAASYGHVLHVEGAIAYLASGTRGSAGGVHIIDVHDPSHPTLLSRANNSSSQFEAVAGLWLSGSFLYISETNGIVIYDVSQPTMPQRLALYWEGGSTPGISVVGDRAYVSSGNGDMHIVDVSTPSQPVLLGKADLPIALWTAHIQGSYAYVALHQYGLQVIDISDPREPVVLDSGYALGQILALQRVGSTLYVATGVSDVQVLDVSNTSRPRVIGHIPQTTPAYRLKVVGSRLYVASTISSSTRILIFDISDPLVPLLLGQYTPRTSARAISAVGDRLYLAGSRGVEIVDIRNPVQPFQLGYRDIDDTNTLIYQYLRQLCWDRVSGWRMNTPNTNNLAKNALQ
jgi:hypothetical protein